MFKSDKRLTLGLCSALCNILVKPAIIVEEYFLKVTNAVIFDFVMYKGVEGSNYNLNARLA